MKIGFVGNASVRLARSSTSCAFIDVTSSRSQAGPLGLQGGDKGSMGSPPGTRALGHRVMGCESTFLGVEGGLEGWVQYRLISSKLHFEGYREGGDSGFSYTWIPDV